MDFICRRCVNALRNQSPKLHRISSASSTRIGFPYNNVLRNTLSRKVSTGGQRPVRVAIIGSGPAGFYTASRLLKHSSLKVDMYERLPVPFGLVRYGVAPDHPEVKNCTERFTEIASSPDFHFLGNVDVGTQIPLDVLSRHYDAVVFTYGASEDRRLGIPGEDLKGIWSAKDFVGWYNGLPGYSELDFNLQDGDTAVLIGQGNVSLDVARVLLTPVDDLRKTDMPEYALQALSKSAIKRVHAVGRRGPLQAAFTIKEIRELTVIPSVSFQPIPRDLFPPDLKSLPRARRRIAELLVKTSSSTQAQEAQRPKTFNLDFLLSPTAFQAHSSNPAHLSSITFSPQTFSPPSDPFSPTANVTALPSAPPQTIQTHLSFRSIGYKSTPLPGLSTLNIPFDTTRGVIPNSAGRITSVSSDAQPGVEVTQPLPGLYVAGWVKRGPTGVIASTMDDAFSTASSILSDIEVGGSALLSGSDGAGWDGVVRDLDGGGVRATTWRDWERIDEVERERGGKLGKEREKIVDVNEMLRVLDG